MSSVFEQQSSSLGGFLPHVAQEAMLKVDQFRKSYLLTFLLPEYMMDSGKVNLTFESANKHIVLW